MANHKNIHRYNTSTAGVLYEVNLDKPFGMQDNDVEPMVQRHYDFFEGKGSPAPVNQATGETGATAAERVQVYRTVGGNFFYSGYPTKYWRSDLFSKDDSPYRKFTEEFQGGDLRHHYTTLSVGTKDALSDPNAYAVLNEDGQSLNKDRLNLVGASDTDAYDRELYPSQINEMLNGIEFFNADFVKRNGTVMTSADESDRLSDGSDSLDISGVEAQSGVGMSKRPIQMRMSFLLHAIPQEEFDELDFDEDGDVDELLATAIRDAVYADIALSSREERMRAFKRHATKQGFVAIEFYQSVQLGYWDAYLWEVFLSAAASLGAYSRGDDLEPDGYHSGGVHDHCW